MSITDRSGSIIELGKSPSLSPIRPAHDLNQGKAPGFQVTGSSRTCRMSLVKRRVNASLPHDVQHPSGQGGRANRLEWLCISYKKCRRSEAFSSLKIIPPGLRLLKVMLISYMSWSGRLLQPGKVENNGAGISQIVIVRCQQTQ